MRKDLEILRDLSEAFGPPNDEYQDHGLTRYPRNFEVAQLSPLQIEPH